MTNGKLSKESITTLLETNDRAVMRALILLKNRQTSDEQVQQSTKHSNGRGFKPCHARKGTDMAIWAEKTGFLTEKMVAYWRKPESNGTMRIACYWRQLIEEAEAKAAARQEEMA